MGNLSSRGIRAWWGVSKPEQQQVFDGRTVINFVDCESWVLIAHRLWLQLRHGCGSSADVEPAAQLLPGTGLTQRLWDGLVHRAGPYTRHFGTWQGWLSWVEFIYLLHFAWVVDDAKCIVVTRVCVSVRGRMPTLLHGSGCNLGKW